MSASIITQEEVDEQLESSESPTTSKDPKIRKRSVKTKRKYISSNEDDTDDDEFSLHSSDLIDESDSDSDISDLSMRLEEIRELLNDSNWKKNGEKWMKIVMECLRTIFRDMSQAVGNIYFYPTLNPTYLPTSVSLITFGRMSFRLL